MSMNKDYNICYLESSYFVSATVNLWQNDGIWVSHIVVAYFKNFWHGCSSLVQWLWFCFTCRSGVRKHCLSWIVLWSTLCHSGEIALIIDMLQTNETELKQFFTVYGAVKDCKIIVDRGGISKRLEPAIICCSMCTVTWLIFSAV